MASKTLKKEVSDKYDLHTVKPGTYVFPGFGEIALDQLTLERADLLVANGFPHLVEKPVKKSKAAAEQPASSAPSE